MRFRSDSTQVAASFSSIDYGTTLIVGDAASIAAFYVVIPGSNDGSETVPNGLYAYRRSWNPLVSLTFEGISYPAVPGGIRLWTAVCGVERRRWRSGRLESLVLDRPGSLHAGYGVFDFDNSRDGFASLA